MDLDKRERLMILLYRNGKIQNKIISKYKQLTNESIFAAFSSSTNISELYGILIIDSDFMGSYFSIDDISCDDNTIIPIADCEDLEFIFSEKIVSQLMRIIASREMLFTYALCRSINSITEIQANVIVANLSVDSDDFYDNIDRDIKYLFENGKKTIATIDFSAPIILDRSEYVDFMHNPSLNLIGESANPEVFSPIICINGDDDFFRFNTVFVNTDIDGKINAIARVVVKNSYTADSSTTLNF